MANQFRKIVGTSLTTDFRKACQVVTQQIPKLKENEVLVKARFAGINATDINVTAGRYGVKDIPFGVGLEGVGEVADVGSNVPKSMIGQPVGYIANGSFSEYLTIPSKLCIPLPDVKPDYIPLLISGLTASIALHETGRIKAGENVLVTAAAGGTGHIAVQIAKQFGCHVIGTCSNEEKSTYLKSIGCDHVINYKTENLYEVLKQTYGEKGIDVVYESVGGQTFQTALNRLAVNGRLIVIGFISAYHSPAGIDRTHRDSTMVTKLLMKSASVNGFFLMNHKEHYAKHMTELVTMMKQGHLEVLLDGSDAEGKRFVGLDSVFDAVDYLYSGKSKGKVCVEIDTSSKL